MSALPERYRTRAPFPSLWCSPANTPASHAGDHRSEAGQGHQFSCPQSVFSDALLWYGIQFGAIPGGGSILIQSSFARNAVEPALHRRSHTYSLRPGSTGGTAFLANDDRIKMDPPPGIAPSWLPYQRSASLKMLWGLKTGVPDRLRSGDLLHERQACWLDYTTGTELVRAP